MIVIDAKDLILGRMATFAAKKLLDGEKVTIINAEHAVISGSKKHVFAKYKKIRDIGDIFKGPFYPRMPDRLVRRTVRGMLPYGKPKGRNAFRNLMVYMGAPDDVKGKPVELDMSKGSLKDQKYVTVLELSRWLGAKV